MTTGQIVVGADDKKGKGGGKVDPSAAWRALGLLGLIFIAAGIVDTSLALYPVRFGDAEWRFVSGGAIIAGWPILMLGSVMLGVARLAEGRADRLLVPQLLNGLVLVVLVVTLVVLALALSPVKAGAQAELQSTIQRSFLKAFVQGLFYALCHVVVLAKLRSAVQHADNTR